MSLANTIITAAKALSFKTNVKPATAEQVRLSLRYYPATKEGFWQFILRSICVSLEVFLHKDMGERYLTVPKAICGGFFIYLCSVLVDWNLQLKPVFSLFKIGFVGLTIGQFTPPEDWYKFNWLWQAPHQEVAGIPALGMTLGIYHLVSNFRLLQVLRGNLLAEHHHNRSSGEPFRVWNFIYLIGHYLNSRVDIVKMICEPLLCFALGMFLTGFLPKPFHFVSIWLILGAIALFLRAYIENLGKKRLVLDRVASERDMEAFHMQQEICPRMQEAPGEELSFSEAKLPKG